jgi:hypothetical protein
MQAVGILFFYPFCGNIARLTTPLFSYRLGIGLYAISYGSVLFIKSQSIDVYTLLALMMGLAESLWSVGTHIVTMDTVENQSRDHFFHIENLLASLASMIAPLLAGIVIVKVGGFTGYWITFGLSVILFLISVFCSFGVPTVRYQRQSNLITALTNPWKPWRMFLFATFIWGIINGKLYCVRQRIRKTDKFANYL